MSEINQFTFGEQKPYEFRSMDEASLYAEEYRRCLIELDVPGIRRVHTYQRPDLPLGTDQDVLATMHMSRAMLPTLDDKLRYYSHRWLLDHGYPSQLPDELKPEAERMYPKIASAVGICVDSPHPGVAKAVHDAMQQAVLEAYAEGHEEPEYVKRRMEEAKQRELRGLGLKV